MDFLKSAVASAIAGGPPFPYAWGDRVDVDESVFDLYNGTKREDGSPCSIFSFDIASNRGLLPLARNALKKLRTLRHPGVLKVLDTVETEAYIYIATERVVPLRWNVRRKSLTPETIKWGLHNVASTIKFINSEAASIHGSVRVGSVYTSESGEWKVGGFELLSSVKEDESTIYTFGSSMRDSARYAPPEVSREGWNVVRKNPHTAVDAFNYGLLIFEAFNGDYRGTDQAGQTKNLPPSMHSSYKRLCNANPKARISVANFLDQGSRTGAFFDTKLIKLTEGIDNLGVKSASDREAFLADLEQLADDFPEDFFKAKVMPELMKSVEFVGGGPKALNMVLKIAAKLSSDDFELRVQPFVVRLFGNPDRALRVCLLEALPSMIDRLPPKVVNDKIFPQIVTGFTDGAPLVREETLKSTLVLVPKLSDRTINGELLRYLAKTANDEQPGIRTNTTICLGKLAKNLNSSSRSKVLIAAFSRSVRDPFVHARNAALMAFGATAEHFSDVDCAGRILPVVCPLLLDKEKLVRDQASRTMDIYVQKVRRAAASMPDSVLGPPQAADGHAPRMGTPQQSETAGGWTSWAISSFTNKLSTAAGDMQTANGSAAPLAGAGASPRPDSKGSRTASATDIHRQAMKSPTPDMASIVSPSPSTVAEEFMPESGWDDGDDGWGAVADDNNDDGFQSAPSEIQEKIAAATPAVPFVDDGEPDFAGWLAAQAQKKSGPGKALPRGLAPSKSAKKPAAKPVAAKKLDMRPKETEDDGEGWGDGW